MMLYPWGVYCSDPETQSDRLVDAYMTESGAREAALFMSRCSCDLVQGNAHGRARFYYACHRTRCTAMPHGMDSELCAEAEGRAPKIQPIR